MKQKMIEKVKKVYEAPSMKVYEIGRAQILSTSSGETEGVGNGGSYNGWE